MNNKQKICDNIQNGQKIILFLQFLLQNPFLCRVVRQKNLRYFFVFWGLGCFILLLLQETVRTLGCGLPSIPT